MENIEVIEKEHEQPAALAVYTDGGCNPSRGAGGWGIHGYVFVEEEPKQGSGCKNAYPSAAGYVHDKKSTIKKVTVLGYVDGWGSLGQDSTNNQAELTGAIKALDAALSLLETGVALATVKLFVDSKYVKDGAQQWVQNWIENDWTKADGQDVSNKELWITLVEKTNTLQEKGIALEWNKVKGHSNDVGNDVADLHAKYSVIVSKKNLEQSKVWASAAKKYWSRRHNPPALFDQGRWYFNSHAGKSIVNEYGEYVYHLGEHGPDDELLGKRISDNSFCVLCTPPVPALEVVREEQDRVDSTQFKSVIIGRLDNIFSQRVYDNLVEHGAVFLYRPGEALDLFWPDETPITKEQRPPRLSFNAIDTLTILENILSYFRRGESFINSRDITDVLYDVVEKPKKEPTVKLKKDFTSATKSFVLDAPYHLSDGSQGEASVTLSFGIDIAKRNSLAGVAGNKPRVYLITWAESADAFRYATVVETDQGIGIWAGIYSNLRIVSK